MMKFSILIIFTLLFSGCGNKENELLNELVNEIIYLKSQNYQLQNKVNILENTLKKYNITPIALNNEHKGNRLYKKVFESN